MTDDYRADQIVQTAVPRWKHTADGAWVRRWEVRLVAAIEPANLSLLSGLSQDKVAISATVGADQRTLFVTTTTKLTPLSDEVFYAAAHRMLRKLDSEIGRIESIQRQPRNIWQPFRQKP